MTEKNYDVIGLGSALMDFLVKVDENKIVELGLTKGNFHLKEKSVLDYLIESGINFSSAPGGSAANTIKAIAHLGGKAILYGAIGNDELGKQFMKTASQIGVICSIKTKNSATGHSIALITPDAERTFSTHLGASVELSKDDLNEEDIANSKVLYLEGYQLEGPPKLAVLQAITLAKNSGTKIAMDLSDPGVIARNKDLIKELLRDIDIIFVNEKEAEAFTGFNNQENSARELAKSVEIAVVKIGEKGSIICNRKNLIRIDHCPAKAIDTTGAGDSYAAGFLYGYCKDWSLEKSGQLGSLLAAKVVEKFGAEVKDINVAELFQLLP